MGYKVKRIMVGTQQVRPTYKTFTIQRTEKSDMSSGWTYSDDAAGLTAGSTEFDRFFGYYGCRLNSSGVETAKVTQEESGGAGKLDITQLGTITSGDNVMIKFPVRGIKMSKSGSTVTLSITKELNKEGYQYYAHSTGTLSNPGTPKNAFYLGAYHGYNDSNVLKSWSGKLPVSNQTLATYCTWAKNNGSGYNTIGYYQRMYIIALYMMKYGNPDANSVIGKGYVGGSAKTNTGGTNSQIGATYGTSSNTTQMKLFGLEDRWGNVWDYVGGGYTNGSRVLYTQLSGWDGSVSGGESTGDTLPTTTVYNLSSIIGNNKSMFIENGTINNTNYNTYYCDYVFTYSQGNRITQAGGGYASSSISPGVFSILNTQTTTATYGDVGSRLMFL